MQDKSVLVIIRKLFHFEKHLALIDNADFVQQRISIYSAI